MDLVRRALVADDQAGVARGIALMLTREYEVDTASGFGEASQLLRAIVYDLVLSDLAMETDDAGLRLLELAARVQPQAVRVLITGGDPPSTSSAHAVLRKPFDLDELQRALAEPLTRRS